MDDLITAAKATSPPRRLILLSGMSGAGLSTALKAYEDLGYEAVDNLRFGLVPALVDDSRAAGQPLAVALDTRNASFVVDDLIAMANGLASMPELDVKIVFLECSDEALQRRYSETRRRHPLAGDRPATDGIRIEREMMGRLRDHADHVIDTSILSILELRRLILGHYRIDTSTGVTLFITSFSYRRGVPREADLVFDARFLVNPHWDEDLRALTGQHNDVATYISKDPDYQKFMSHMAGLLLPLLPRYQQEGKSYLTIGVGCTGGRHRSVFVAEQLATLLAVHGYIVGVGHRDLDRRDAGA